jgi:hypothetical protein
MNHNRIEASERARFLAIIWASATRRGNSPKSGGFKSHGVPGAAVKEEMTVLEARRLELLAQLEAAPASLPRLHPNLAELYRQKVTNLAEALNDEHTRLEAAECIRELIDEIRLVPDNGQRRVELYGELAAPLRLANGHPAPRKRGCPCDPLNRFFP